MNHFRRCGRVDYGSCLESIRGLIALRGFESYHRLYFLPVGVMAAQGSLKPLVFVRSEYRQLCYMSSLKWQLTILDERDIDRKGQCVINPAGTAVRWRPVRFKIKGLTKVNSFFIFDLYLFRAKD